MTHEFAAFALHQIVGSRDMALGHAKGFWRFLISYLQGRRILWPCAAFVVQPGRADIRVA